MVSRIQQREGGVKHRKRNLTPYLQHNPETRHQCKGGSLFLKRSKLRIIHPKSAHRLRFIVCKVHLVFRGPLLDTVSNVLHLAKLDNVICHRYDKGLYGPITDRRPFKLPFTPQNVTLKSTSGFLTQTRVTPTKPLYFWKMSYINTLPCNV